MKPQHESQSSISALFLAHAFLLIIASGLASWFFAMIIIRGVELHDLFLVAGWCVVLLIDIALTEGNEVYGDESHEDESQGRGASRGPVLREDSPRLDARGDWVDDEHYFCPACGDDLPSHTPDCPMYIPPTLKED